MLDILPITTRLIETRNTQYYATSVCETDSDSSGGPLARLQHYLRHRPAGCFIDKHQSSGVTSCDHEPHAATESGGIHPSANHAMANTSLPCLVFEYGDERPTTLYGAADGAHRPCEIDVLLTKQNWVTAHGWVLARDPDTSATFLWDPQDPEHGRVVLPSLPQAPPLGSDCVLSGDPTSPDGCTVVLPEPYDSTALWYCHAGSASPEWVRYEYDLGGKLVVIGKHRSWLKRCVFGLTPYRGRFYFPIQTNKYGVLEFSPEPALSTVKTKGIKLTYPPSGEKCVHAWSSLLDLDGELHKVSISFADLEMRTVNDVAVYKMGFDGSRCVRVDDIGDRAILLSSRSNMAGWCPASKFGLLSNSLYWMSGFDKCLHVYDIGTNTEEVRQCQDIAEQSSLPFWLVPVHRA
uniref:KIB1-4 beta-propeller domain-containing protein n=2 Tax=Hordeum vulgare subsp. vulgare TaxID=112509 RepID=A0A8I6Y8A4_HORVV